MNELQSKALYQKGKDEWNAWANKMLKRRPDDIAQRKAWERNAAVHFCDSVLTNADFSGFIFPGKSVFEELTFEGNVSFDQARFSGSAIFLDVVFRHQTDSDGVEIPGRASFQTTKFEKTCIFHASRFRINADFSNAMFGGSAWFLATPFDHNVNFNDVTFEDNATFNKNLFGGSTTFQRAHFKNNADFQRTNFGGISKFNQSRFMGEALFSQSIFKNDAEFLWVCFCGDAEFRKARFEDDASFDKADFKADATFALVEFANNTSFEHVTYSGNVDFSAIRGGLAFSMSDAMFDTAVPNFDQATFTEAPRLDKIGFRSIRPQGACNHISGFFRGDENPEARWRALKRLAIQGHDYAQEQFFFRRELLARRWKTDKVWHAAYWFGLLYQLFSNFGNSLLLPLIWWSAGTLGFANAYCHAHHSMKQACGAAASWPLGCLGQSKEIVTAALGFSLRRSLPGLSSFGDPHLEFDLRLFGALAEQPATPAIPEGVWFLGIVQILFSAAMVFFFLLALRNRFRMK